MSTRVFVIGIISLSAALLAGCPETTVPNVIGLTRPAAESALTDANLALGTVGEARSETVEQGLVMSQRPSAGASVSPGSSVAITISLGPEPTVNVPDLVGQTQAEAESALSGVGLTLGAVSDSFSDTVAIGRVLSQDPAADTSVASGTSVAITVSLGPSSNGTPVPDLLGLAQAQAEAALTSVGLTLGTVGEVFSDTVAGGLVVNQEPAAGTTVVSGTSVAVTVSLGPASNGTTVPDLLGLTQTQAEAALTSVGLTLGTVSEAYSDTVTAGLVVTQEPAAGAPVSSGSAIAISVSLGPESVIVPDVVGLSQANAQTALTNAGLTVGATNEAYSESVAAGLVISQEPPAGVTAPRGSSVTITVSIGPDPDGGGDNTAPIADAGPDMTVKMYANVRLQGAAEDQDGDELTLTWTQTGGAEVALEGLEDGSARFVAPLVEVTTIIRLSLIATDEHDATGTDEAVITVEPLPPLLLTGLSADVVQPGTSFTVYGENLEGYGAVALIIIDGEPVVPREWDSETGSITVAVPFSPEVPVRGTSEVYALFPQRYQSNSLPIEIEDLSLPEEVSAEEIFLDLDNAVNMALQEWIEMIRLEPGLLTDRQIQDLESDFEDLFGAISGEIAQELANSGAEALIQDAALIHNTALIDVLTDFRVEISKQVKMYKGATHEKVSPCTDSGRFAEIVEANRTQFIAKNINRAIQLVDSISVPLLFVTGGTARVITIVAHVTDVITRVSNVFARSLIDIRPQLSAVNMYPNETISACFHGDFEPESSVLEEVLDKSMEYIVSKGIDRWVTRNKRAVDLKLDMLVEEGILIGNPESIDEFLDAQKRTQARRIAQALAKYINTETPYFSWLTEQLADTNVLIDTSAGYVRPGIIISNPAHEALLEFDPATGLFVASPIARHIAPEDNNRLTVEFKVVADAESSGSSYIFGTLPIYSSEVYSVTIENRPPVATGVFAYTRYSMSSSNFSWGHDFGDGNRLLDPDGDALDIIFKAPGNPHGVMLPSLLSSAKEPKFYFSHDPATDSGAREDVLHDMWQYKVYDGSACSDFVDLAVNILPNFPPELSGEMPVVEVSIGEAVEINVDDYFLDTDESEYSGNPVRHRLGFVSWTDPTLGSLLEEISGLPEDTETKTLLFEPESVGEEMISVVVGDYWFGLPALETAAPITGCDGILTAGYGLPTTPNFPVAGPFSPREFEIKLVVTGSGTVGVEGGGIDTSAIELDKEHPQAGIVIRNVGLGLLVYTATSADPRVKINNMESYTGQLDPEEGTLVTISAEDFTEDLETTIEVTNDSNTDDSVTVFVRIESPPGDLSVLDGPRTLYSSAPEATLRVQNVGEGQLDYTVTSNDERILINGVSGFAETVAQDGESTITIGATNYEESFDAILLFQNLSDEEDTQEVEIHVRPPQEFRIEFDWTCPSGGNPLILVQVAEPNGAVVTNLLPTGISGEFSRYIYACGGPIVYENYGPETLEVGTYSFDIQNASFHPGGFCVAYVGATITAGDQTYEINRVAHACGSDPIVGRIRIEFDGESFAIYHFDTQVEPQ